MRPAAGRRRWTLSSAWGFASGRGCGPCAVPARLRGIACRSPRFALLATFRGITENALAAAMREAGRSEAARQESCSEPDFATLGAALMRFEIVSHHRTSDAKG